jgi:hypothetical protein
MGMLAAENLVAVLERGVARTPVNEVERG